MFEFRVFTRRRGAALLLSLLILGSLVAASVTVGILVATNLRSVRAVDDAIIASYVAESGIESLLYGVRREERTPEDLATGTDANPRIAIDPPPTQLFFELAKDDVAEFDVSGNTDAKLQLVIPRPNCQQTIGCPFLEVTWLVLLNDGTWSPTTHGKVIGESMYRNNGQQTPVNVPLDVTPGETASLFRVRMRNIHRESGIGQVNVSGVSGIAPMTFDSRVVATVTGSHGSAKQAYRVAFLRRAPLSPIFNNVLFSECDIIKGGRQSDAQCQ